MFPVTSVLRDLTVCGAGRDNKVSWWHTTRLGELLNIDYFQDVCLKIAGKKAEITWVPA